MTTVNRLIGVLLVLIGASTAQAQMVMHTTVLPDRVLIGGEFTPRRLDLPNSRGVAPGTVFEPEADSSFTYLEVGGTLRVSRTHDTRLSVTTLAILPMATFDFGTVADPIPANIRIELTINDVPIDLTRDPFQWGNGLINFGHATMVGAEKTAFLPLASGVAIGSTSVTLSADVIGWSDGGINGLLLAMRHPEKVKKLAVTGANLWPDTVAVYQEVWDMVRPMYAAMKKKTTRTPEEKNEYKLLNLLCEQPHIPLTALHTIHCPTLVIGGDHDVIKPEHTMQIASNIPHSYLWILPNSGHSTPVAYSALFNKTVDDFFSRPFREIKGEARFY